MFIVSKDRDVVVNIDNITNLYIENGNNILARTVDSEEILLGRYLDHAGDVFKELLGNIFVPNMVVTNQTIPDDFAEQFKGLNNKPWGIALADGANVVPYAIDVYYMPEE